MRSNRIKSATWGRTLLTLSAILLSAILAYAGPATNHKMSSDLQGKTLPAQVNVIVQFNHVPNVGNHQMVQSWGGVLRRELPSVKGATYSVPASALASLASDPSVVYISPNRHLKSAGTASTSQLLDYHLETINASAAVPLGLDGTGVGVAVIDSGVASVGDLSNLVYSEDFVGDNGGSATDLFGHGTHVAGIIAGNGSNSTGRSFSYTFHGIAPNVNLIDLRVLDANASGTDSEVIAAIERAIELKNKYNIRVINLSLGRGVYESYTQDPLCQAVEQAWQAGIVVVTSAGNDGRDDSAGTNGYGTITAPGNDPYVITVGAMNTHGTADRTDDLPASYSAKGPTLGDLIMKPDLVAPGNAIISLYTPMETLNQEDPGNEVSLSLYRTNGATGASGSYYILSGTSMAAPMVSGAAALLLQQNPNLTPDQVKAVLMESAFRSLVPNGFATNLATGQSISVAADMFTVGAGYLDIQAALAVHSFAPPAMGSAMSPYATTDSNGDIVLVLNPNVTGVKIAWRSVDGEPNIVWGSTLGSQNIAWAPVNGSLIAWSSANGSNTTWGSIDGAFIAQGTVDGSNIAWGSIDGASNIAWGSIDSAQNIAWGSIDGLNIAWGSLDGANIAWGSVDGANIAWGSIDGANIAWGSVDGATSSAAAQSVSLGDK